MSKVNYIVFLILRISNIQRELSSCAKPVRQMVRSTNVGGVVFVL